MNIIEAMGIMHPGLKLAATIDQDINLFSQALVAQSHADGLSVDLGELISQTDDITQWLTVNGNHDLYGVCFDRVKNEYYLMLRSGASYPLEENSIERFLEEVRGEAPLIIEAHTEEDCDGIYTDYLE